ncbi:MAG: hypothetical protein IH621_07790, partial [Krumholzibacteria bacterium]|nr:hypothetical protein [Candidatus Krumholzibacteria bacterium]
MFRSRARILPAVGVGCLVGQGILLGLAAAAPPGQGGAVLPARGLFLLLTVLLTVVLSFCPAARGHRLARRLWRVTTLVGVAVLLALAVWN